MEDNVFSEIFKSPERGNLGGYFETVARDFVEYIVEVVVAVGGVVAYSVVVACGVVVGSVVVGCVMMCGVWVGGVMVGTVTVRAVVGGKEDNNRFLSSRINISLHAFLEILSISMFSI
jgi:hypothetical protein